MFIIFVIDIEFRKKFYRDRGILLGVEDCRTHICKKAPRLVGGGAIAART